MILKYKGKKAYKDPEGRFVVKPGELVDFLPDEAKKMLKRKTWVRPKKKKKRK